jgi:hypothetical protein
LVVVTALDYFLRGADNGFGKFRTQKTQFKIHLRGMLLDHTERPDEGPWKAETADGEVIHGPLGLSPEKGPYGHADLAHAILL